MMNILNSFLQEFFFILPFLALAGLCSPAFWRKRRDPAFWFVMAAAGFVLLTRGAGTAFSSGFSSRYWLVGVILLILPGACGLLLPAKLIAGWSRRAALAVVIACCLAVAVVGILKTLRPPAADKRYLRSIAADISAACPDVALSSSVYADHDDWIRVRKYNPEIGEFIQFFDDTTDLIRNTIQPRLVRGKSVFVMYKGDPEKIFPAEEFVVSKIATYRSGKKERYLVRVMLRLPALVTGEIEFIPERVFLAAGRKHTLSARNFTATKKSWNVNLQHLFWPRFTDKIVINPQIGATAFSTTTRLIRNDGVVFAYRDWRLSLTQPKLPVATVSDLIDQVPEATKKWCKLPGYRKWIRIVEAGARLELPPDQEPAVIAVWPPAGWSRASENVRGEFLTRLSNYEKALRAGGYHQTVILPLFLLWTSECDVSPIAREALLAELVAAWLDKE